MATKQKRAHTAFINLAYVDSNEQMFLALIAGLAGFGLVPVAALHDPTTDPQLARIFGLLEDSVISFHDLSYVRLDDPKPKTPRFNMPFELGLAVASALGSNREHRWFVLDTKAHRAWKALSDISGSNVQLHNRKAPAVMRAISNALARHNPHPTLAQLLAIYEDVRAKAHKLKTVDRWPNVFLPAPFKDLRIYANLSAITHVPGLTPYVPAKLRGRKP